MPVLVAGPVFPALSSLTADLFDATYALRCSGYVTTNAADLWPAFGGPENADARAAYTRRCLAALAEGATALMLTAGWMTDATARLLALVAAQIEVPAYRAGVTATGRAHLDQITASGFDVERWPLAAFDRDPLAAEVPPATPLPFTPPAPDRRAAVLAADYPRRRANLAAIEREITTLAEVSAHLTQLLADAHAQHQRLAEAAS